MPSDDEEIRYALSILDKHKDMLPAEATKLRDSFDLGPLEQSRPEPTSIQQYGNVQDLAKSFNLTTRQKENVESIIVGGGTAFARKHLSKYIGTGPASIIGAGLSDLLLKKFKGG